VEAELGKGKSAKRGTHEILTFPNKVRIELDDGIVTDIKGYTPAAAAVATTLAPAAAAGAPAAAPPASAQPPAKTPPGGNPAPKSPHLNPAGGYSSAAAANALGDEVAKMDTAWGPRPPDPIHKKSVSVLELAFALVVRFGLTLLALRVAFKYWEMDAFWTGTFAIAGIDAAFHGVLEALGPASGGFTTLGPVENGIPGLLMIFTIRHFCFNKRLQNAVLTASAVKVMMTLINIVSMTLLKAVFDRSVP